MRNILIPVIIFIVISCDNHVNNTAETQVEFTNLEQFKVVLYSDSSRHNIFAEIDADSTKTVPAVPNTSGITYYPTYYIDVPDIPEASIPYNEQAIIGVIEANKTNKVFIPQLENIVINTAYLKIINDSIYSLLLQQGGNEKPPLGGKPSIIAPQGNAAYEVNPGASTSYKVMRNTTIPVGFPADFTEFEKGKVYIFTYNANLVLTRIWPIPSPVWPAAPVNVQAELISTGSVRLSWDAIYDAESYQVYRALNSATLLYYRIAATNTPSYTNTGLSNDFYYYKVSAIKDSKEGEQSKAIPARIVSHPGSWGTIGGDTFVLYYWSNISGTNSYNIYRSETEDGNYLKVDTVKPDSGTYSFSWGGTGLEPSTTYYFRLSAVFDGIESLQLPAKYIPTVQPLNFRVTETTATSISLLWDRETDYFNRRTFSIYRSASENGTFTRIINNLTVNNYIDSGISPNSTYYYYIGITYNAGGSDTFTKLLTDKKVSATTGGE